MILQQALAAGNMNDVCENKYVKMAYAAGNLNPQLQQILNLVGCNGPNRKYGSSTIPTNVPRNRLSTTTSAFPDNENEEEEDLQSGLPPEKESKIKQLLSIARGEKGAKTDFLKNLFGLNKNI